MQPIPYYEEGKTSLQHVETSCHYNAARRSHDTSTKTPQRVSIWEHFVEI